MRQRWQNWRAGAAGTLLTIALLTTPLLAQSRPPRAPAAPQSFDGQAWRRVPVRPGGALGPEPAARPAPPRAGRHRCIDIGTVAAAQLFGDRALELTLKGGQRWRMYLAQECPALSFYQGFYYQQQQAGQLCAGRDAIGSRSGGECGIAAIVPVKPERRAPRR